MGYVIMLLLAQFGAGFITFFAFLTLGYYPLGMLFALVVCPLGCAFLFFLAGSRCRLPQGFVHRYLPFLLPLWCALCLAAVQQLTTQLPLSLNGIGGFFTLLFYGIAPGFILLFWASFALGARVSKTSPPTPKHPRLLWIPGTILAGLICVSGLQMLFGQNIFHTQPGEQIISEEINLRDYAPFDPGNKVMRTIAHPDITFDADYPRLDGATAAYPVYSAITQTLYRDLDKNTVQEYVTCSKTNKAYQRLIAGEADMVFGVRPSEEQLEDARNAGVELILTPICLEAFVFFVNEDNPVDGLTVEQIRSIYTKRTTRWRDVGGTDDHILPFQRPVNSGSQTIMEAVVMEGEVLAKAMEEEVMVGMGDILYQTANYRNRPNAIGYSFRYYATQMNPQSGVKLLSIDGTAPLPENIQDHSYPFTVEVYAVTTDKSMELENTRLLLDWILSPQGQSVIGECGYTPLY